MADKISIPNLMKERADRVTKILNAMEGWDLWDRIESVYLVQQFLEVERQRLAREQGNA